MRELHGLTLVDVPKQCWAKYADLVVQVIAEVESAEPAVLNSTRSPEESQMVAVNRRIRNLGPNFRTLRITTGHPRNTTAS